MSVSSMKITCVFYIGLRFRGVDRQNFHVEEFPKVITVVIQLRDGVLAPPYVQEAARQAQLQALGLDQPQAQAQPVFEDPAQ